MSKSRFSLLAATLGLSSLSCLAMPASAVWTTGDFDGDRRPDIAILPTSPGAAGITVLSGSSSYAAPAFDWPDSAALTTRDIDSDLDADLVLRSSAGRTLRVWLNDGSARFREVDPAGFADAYRGRVWLGAAAHRTLRGPAGLARVRNSIFAAAPASAGNLAPPAAGRTPAALTNPYFPRTAGHPRGTPQRGPPPLVS